jgi:hypothetical protein
MFQEKCLTSLHIEPRGTTSADLEPPTPMWNQCSFPRQFRLNFFE